MFVCVCVGVRARWVRYSLHLRLPSPVNTANWNDFFFANILTQITSAQCNKCFCPNYGNRNESVVIKWLDQMHKYPFGEVFRQCSHTMRAKLFKWVKWNALFFTTLKAHYWNSTCSSLDQVGYFGRTIYERCAPTREKDVYNLANVRMSNTNVVGKVNLFRFLLSNKGKQIWLRDVLDVCPGEFACTFPIFNETHRYMFAQMNSFKTETCHHQIGHFLSFCLLSHWYFSL